MNSTKGARGWVITLTGIGSLMAALDTLRGASIGEIIAFLTPHPFEYFGLPDEVEP